MQVRRLMVRHFRGLQDLTLCPTGHVVLMGPRGSGKSHVLDALWRIFDPDSFRRLPPSELDFTDRDTSHPIEIEVVIGQLGVELEEDHLARLELWDPGTRTLIESASAAGILDDPAFELVLRLAYRADWIPADERADEARYYPKQSDPAAGSLVRATRDEITNLAAKRVTSEGGSPLAFGTRAPFRQIVEQAGGDDFDTAARRYLQQVGAAAAEFTESDQVTEAISSVVEPLRNLLELGDRPTTDLVEFVPQGGSLSGLLRSVVGAIDLDDGAGALTPGLHGSTVATLVRVTETLAAGGAESNLSIVDDLGDGLDPASAVHIAGVLRGWVSQAWIATRLPSVAELFAPTDVVRLARSADGSRVAYQATQPETKQEALAARHWGKAILPSLSYRSVIIVEGPDDLRALMSVSAKRWTDIGDPLPATVGALFISPGVSESGGWSGVVRLAAASRLMGLRTVAVLDGDTDSDAVAKTVAAADAVVRLPEGCAIERALLRGVPPDVVRTALAEVEESATWLEDVGFASMSDDELGTAAVKYLKKGGLHSSFVEVLPNGVFPPVALQVVERALDASAGTVEGLEQV